VFTASQKVYADQVLNKLDPDGLIEHRLCRESCTYYEGNYIKDLSILGRPLAKSALLDNTPLCYGFQPMNGVPSQTWTHQPDDRELFDLIPVLDAVADAADVRVALEDRYQTKRLIEWLRHHLEQQNQQVA
jgi:CTD small phosphatase-like protein 2